MTKIVPFSRKKEHTRFYGETGKTILNPETDGQSRFIFIDWLSVKQRHYENLPIVNGSVVVKYDSDSGDIEYETHCFRPHKGSYETTINVRCDGSTISLSGNPSRYNKLDNLFGLSSIVACVNLYNDILKHYGLPLLDNNAEFTRVDITENYAVGAGNEIDHIRHLSSANFRGESGYIYPNGATVDWFRSSKRHYLKVYSKAVELRKHRTKTKNSKGVESSEMDYLDELTHNVNQAGVLRVEYTLKANILRDNNLRKYKGETMGQLIKLFDKKNPYKQKSKHINKVDSSSILESAYEAGFTSRQARTIRNNYELWLAGVDLKSRFSKSQFYLLRKNLMLCGVDVTKPMTVERLQYNIKTLHALPLMPSDDYLNYSYSLKRLAN